MSAPLVSVIIPVYNGERYVAQAIQSVLAQDYPQLEIIVVDDGSTDGSAAIVQSFPVLYIGGSNRGVAQARNTGITASHGEFIAFLDQDDHWPVNKLSLQIDHMMRHAELGYTVGWQNLYLESGVERPVWLKPELLNGPQHGYLPGTFVARRWAFENIGMFDPTFAVGSDSDWFFRARDMQLPMAVLPHVLLHRRIHTENQSHEIGNIIEMFQLIRLSLRRKAAQKKEDNDVP